jgi:hypothetical protein
MPTPTVSGHGFSRAGQQRHAFRASAPAAFSLLAESTLHELHAQSVVPQREYSGAGISRGLGHQQGLKPNSFPLLIGTAEAMP